THVTPLGADEGGAFLNPRYTATFSGPFDGVRRQGVYYQTPSLAGFLLSAGWSHDTQDKTEFDTAEYWEVALRYAGEFNGVRIAAGVGYRHEDSNSVTPDWDENDVWMASAS